MNKKIDSSIDQALNDCAEYGLPQQVILYTNHGTFVVMVAKIPEDEND